MIDYKSCPVCKSEDFQKVLNAKDDTVTGESFTICHCNKCSHRFTNPVPAADEIGKYYQSEEYISHSNTSQGFINNLYQRVRKITLKGKRKLVRKSTGKGSGELLDIGSGAGAFLATMKEAGWKVTGLEPDEGARKVANADFNVLAKPIEEFYNLKEDSYDVITMWHVLEHVHELDAYMEKIFKLLKTDGTLIVAVPNYNSYDADKYKELWAAYDVPRHLYHFSATSMKSLLERFGFKLHGMKRMPFDSYYVSMLSERNRKGSMVRAIWNGFCSYWVALLNKERCSSIIYVVKK